jgi:hypothetical protein
MDTATQQKMKRCYNNIPQNDDFSESISLLEQARVDYTKEPEPPPVGMRINGEAFGTLGNFSLVIGKAKSKKTFLITMALAGAVKGELVGNVFSGTLPKGKQKVIFVDTEQARYDVIKVAQRVLQLSDLDNPDNFEVFSLRKFSTEERKTIIEQIIETNPDLGLLVIDGVRDLVTSINNEEEATGLATNLLKWTEERQVHIITVLHQNKNDYNARGHLGTELVNKAEITISVKSTNNEISKVKPEYCRHKPFQPFAIRINESELPERVDGWQPKKQHNSTGKYNPDEVNGIQHWEILHEVKSQVNGTKPKHSEITSQLKTAIGNHVQKVGNNKVKDYLKFYMNRDYIVKHGKDHSPNAYHTIEIPNDKNDDMFFMVS